MKQRGRAKLRLYPGLKLPDDCLVINVMPDDGRGCCFALLEGEYLPLWQNGQIPYEFMSVDELEQWVARRTLEALGSDDSLQQEVWQQKQFQFTYPQLGGLGTSATFGTFTTNNTSGWSNTAIPVQMTSTGLTGMYPIPTRKNGP